MAIDQTPDKKYPTGLSARLAARNKTFTSVTAGVAPSYLQANLIVLPSRYADDFRLLCARNPVPCPLVAESLTPGDATLLRTHVDEVVLEVAEDIDLRHDFPKYRLYRNGQADGGDVLDIASVWTDDHVGFVIGCSYSFESALSAAGLTPRHQVQGRNVPMYRTNIPLCPAGVFTGATYVVSMRPYKLQDVEKVRDITRPYVATHGEPIAWGWDGAKKLGIEDITRVQWGDQSLRLDGSGQPFDESEQGFVPVFWGCGVTPQNAVEMAGLQGTIMAHSPGHMIVLDVREHEVFPTAVEKV
ncbi:DUF1445-domain-containing protein [Cryphonectria parasitica EP155]|uniref:DUF1445-domain-containing protein n=1 Tax=Cryphonectria parasitica (strain ATCC 38755 / EP155) TaxID=660469 RepID=A0A9P4XZ56_CRYP1|nr:DUF1445-domain-containing protein [Cryphonectria parasitica EP155]KAF3763215.1 DUF1445-domain-containing protein [Cryphonectria parasitica EP155]